jgi:hypothetical protein
MRAMWITVALVTAVLATDSVSLQHRRPDGGVWDLPHKNPDTLRPADVDSLMWPIVQRINRNGWVWTTESCQGHDEGQGQRDPLLGLVTDDIGRALSLLSDAVLQDGIRYHIRDGDMDPHGGQILIAYFIRPRVSRGRYQVRLQFRATDAKERERVLTMLADFAERVAPAETAKGA